MANQGGERDPAVGFTYRARKGDSTSGEEIEGIAAKERKNTDAFEISAAFSGKGENPTSPYLPSALAASATLTAELSMIESDGSRITTSSVFRPDKTSTVLP